MTNRELERRIRRAVNSATPDIYEHIASDSAFQEEREIGMESRKTVKRTAKKCGWMIGGAAAACAAVFIACFGLFQLMQANSGAVDAIVSIDVNPSVELSINKEDKVIHAKALNADAGKILDGMKLEQVDLNVAVNAIIGSMLKYGYLDDLANAVLVSVENGDETRSSALKKQISEDIAAMLEQNNQSVTLLNQNITSDEQLMEFAKKHGISYGKALFIYQIAQKDNSLVMDQLAGMSISRLCNLVNTKGILLDDFVEIDDDDDHPLLSGRQYIGEEKAREIALQKVPGATVVSVKLDREGMTAEYELKLKKGQMGYEVEIDALTGAVTDYEEKPVQSTEQDDDDDIDEPDDDASVSAPPVSEKLITAEQAKAVAAAKLPGGVFVEFKLEKDDGVWKYEGEIKQGKTEAEFEINAQTAAVIKWDVEQDD